MEIQPQYNSELSSTPGSHWKKIVSRVIILLILLGTYYVAAKIFDLWPYQVTWDTTSPIPAEIPSNWGTYTNQTVGFSFQYPNTFTLHPESPIGNSPLNNIGFTLSDKQPFTGYFSINVEYGMDRSNFIPSGSRHMITGSVIAGDRTLTYEAAQFHPLGPLGRNWYLGMTIDGNVYSIGFIDENNTDQTALVRQILSTFRFTKSIFSGWKTYTNTEAGYEFRYPEKLSAQFVSWSAPTITIRDTGGVFGCYQVSKTINGTVYCVKTNSEGAAGTTWIDATYETMKDSKLITLHTQIGYPECQNFDGPLVKQCQQEQAAFQLDTLADQILSTFKFANSVDTSNWKTYTNTTYGFGFEYPTQWTTSQANVNWSTSLISPIRLTSPALTEALKSCGVPCEASVSDLSVLVSNQTNLTLDSYVTQQSDFSGKTSTTLAGSPAYEGTRDGLSTYYVIFTVHNGRAYELFFDHATSKAELTAEEKQIISTFKFTK